MLVLSRKAGEEIYIGGNIVIRVLGLECGKVRIGIQAPPETKIHRKECLRNLDDHQKEKLING